MELKGDVSSPPLSRKVWAGLNDPEILKACIAGCESLERTGDDASPPSVAVRVGPVSAKFKGNLKMSDVKPPTSYTLHFDGQGGVAGFGRARPTCSAHTGSRGNPARATLRAPRSVARWRRWARG